VQCDARAEMTVEMLLALPRHPLQKLSCGQGLSFYEFPLSEVLQILPPQQDYPIDDASRRCILLSEMGWHAPL